jgi:hypothetical protein
MAQKFFILILFTAGLILITKPQHIIESPDSASLRFAKLWNADIAKLKAKGTFPVETDIKKINYIPGNHLARTLIFKANPQIAAKGEKKGKYLLEVTVMAWSQKDHGLVVQYELFEGKKRNKAWEFARTFTF